MAVCVNSTLNETTTQTQTQWTKTSRNTFLHSFFFFMYQTTLLYCFFYVPNNSSFSQQQKKNSTHKFKSTFVLLLWFTRTQTRTFLTVQSSCLFSLIHWRLCIIGKSPKRKLNLPKFHMNGILICLISSHFMLVKKTPVRTSHYQW